MIQTFSKKNSLKILKTKTVKKYSRIVLYNFIIILLFHTKSIWKNVFMETAGHIVEDQ